jgi:uncharacterized protein (DUF697 family)
VLLNPLGIFRFSDRQPSVAERNITRERAQTAAPVVWLIGKTGAGKTAIVSALTGDPRAEIGEGFEPCTRTAAFYDVPAEAPLLRFLDTRGLGEVRYDPASDIEWCEKQSHLLLAVMQVADPAQQSVIDAVAGARLRHDDWPIVVAQTGLHRLYSAGGGHIHPYPFTGNTEDENNPPLPHSLRQALAHQRRLFQNVAGPPPRFVPIDFSLPEDGFPPYNYGIEGLWSALEDAGPGAFEALHFAQADADNDRIRAQARPLIYGYAGAAAGTSAVPLPLLGAGALASILGLTVRSLGDRYDMSWTAGALTNFGAAVGAGTLMWWSLRYCSQEMLKFVPMFGSVTAAALNAVSAFGVTVGIGEAACVWLSYRRRGLAAPDREVRRAFAEGLATGLRHAKNKSLAGDRA